MKTCNTLFKTTCDACSKSKTKCDGGNPCEVCQKKNLPCKYAFRMKRGPKGPAEGAGSKRPSKAIPRVMSSFERRLWSVFFTIFKNTKSSNAESKFAWCWYAKQLNKLHDYFAKSGNERLISLLDQFYLSLDYGQQELKEKVTKVCPVAPTDCGSCSSLVILPEESEKLLSSFDSSIPHIKMTEFEKEFRRNEKPCLVYFSGEGKEHGFKVNEIFHTAFNYDSAGLNNLLHWSNGGFLPFNGDLFSALFVHESDVLLYLQIMSFKYKAARLLKGEPKINQKWRVPSCHAFKCWSRISPNSELEPCDVYFHLLISMESTSHKRHSTKVEMVVHSISPVEEKIDEKLTPTSHEFPLVEVKSRAAKRRKLESTVSEKQDIQKTLQPVPQNAPQPVLRKAGSSEKSLEPVVRSGTLQRLDTIIDSLPDAILQRCNSWSQFSDSRPIPRSDTLDFVPDNEQALREYGDGEWFQSISQWALLPANNSDAAETGKTLRGSTGV